MSKYAKLYLEWRHGRRDDMMGKPQSAERVELCRLPMLPRAAAEGSGQSDRLGQDRGAEGLRAEEGTARASGRRSAPSLPRCPHTAAWPPWRQAFVLSRLGKRNSPGRMPLLQSVAPSCSKKNPRGRRIKNAEWPGTDRLARRGRRLRTGRFSPEVRCSSQSQSRLVKVNQSKSK